MRLLSASCGLQNSGTMQLFNGDSSPTQPQNPSSCSPTGENQQHSLTTYDVAHGRWKCAYKSACSIRPFVEDMCEFFEIIEIYFVDGALRGTY